MKLVLFLLLPCCVLAQNFRYKAQVGPVSQSGYHRVELSSDVVGRLQDGLGDLRLYDGRKREVSYLLTRQTGAEATAFVAFDVVKKSSVPNGSTTVVMKRSGKQPIQSIGVEMQNTNVEKRAALSGSNDGTAWYALDEAVFLGRNTNSATTTTRQTILFPLIDYTYFRLIVNDSTSAPLNILRVGSYGQTSASAKYTPIQGLRFTQIDSSDHYTYLLFSRPSPARLDQLTIHVSNPAQFQRQAALGSTFTETVIGKRRKRTIRSQSFNPLVSFTLSSVGDTTVQLSGLLTNKLCLRIANEDNPPLQIRAIEAAQLTTYLTASLQADSTYQLQFGDPAAASPVYDLAYFKNQLPGTLPTAPVGDVTSTHEATVQEAASHNNYLVWGATLAVLILLGAMTYRLLKEAGN